MILSKHRVAKMRQVLQNGMSFANEREFLRCLCASAIMICLSISNNFIGLSKFILGDFFMQKKVKKLLFSEILVDLSKTQRIAYIAVMSALCVICNMFFVFKLADTQFSLTIFFSAMTGMIIGPIFGFVACFLGDLVGFLYNSGGFMYYPWIGLSMGLIAIISGVIINGIEFKNKFGVYLKIGIVCVLTFAICTVAINTTMFWVMYNTRKVPFTAYLFTRLFVQGQIWNSLLNYAMLFALYPVILRIKNNILHTNKN